MILFNANECLHGKSIYPLSNAVKYRINGAIGMSNDLNKPTSSKIL